MDYEQAVLNAQLADRIMRLARKVGIERIADEPQGLSAGVPRTFFVGSTLARASVYNDGMEPLNPFATIQQAVDAALSGRGDIIYVLPNHVETVTAQGGLTLNKANLTIIGLGHGAYRPTVNFTTAVSASMLVSAAGVCVDNFLFTGSVDALTNPIHIQAADFKFYNCETRDTASAQATDFIVTTDAADRLHIRDWKHLGHASAGADTALSIVGCDDIVVEDFEIYGNFAVAGIEQVTTAGNRHRYGGGKKWCYIWTEHAKDVAITLKSDTTGHVGPNINAMLQDNAANFTGAFVGAAAQFFQPLNIVNLVGESSAVTNITASTHA
jgi:hypothetical protein